MTARTLGDMMLVLWAVPAVLAPLVYLGVRDWRRTPLGIHLMAFMSAYAFLGALGLVRLIFDDGPVWQALRAAGFVALIFVTWWRLGLVAQTLADYRRSRAAAERRERDRDATGL